MIIGKDKKPDRKPKKEPEEKPKYFEPQDPYGEQAYQDFINGKDLQD